jgi:hypothetical protein
MIENQKVRCDDFKCGWHGMFDETLSAKNPFETADDTAEIHACPSCRMIQEFRVACDEEGCWEFVSCGTPTESGYRQTCGKHCPK